MAVEIGLSTPGNLDNKNFYVDQNNNFYYDALYDQLPEVPGQFTGNIVEIKDWNTGERLFGPALNNLSFSTSNYRPPIAGSVSNPGQAKPSDLFTLKQNAAPADPEPLDIAAMDVAAEKQAVQLARVNNAAEQVQAAKAAGVENANTSTPEPEEKAAVDQTGGTNSSMIDGRITATKTNAMPNPLGSQLIPEGGDEFTDIDVAPPFQPSGVPVGGDEYAIVGGETDGGYEGDTFTPNADKTEVFDDGWAPNINNGQFGSTKGTGAGGTDTKTIGTASPLPSQFIEKITPKTNPLNAFASYSYNVSLYLVNKTGLQRLQNGEKTVQGLPLILQSGGASTGTDLYGAKRSPYFNLDYYIDDIELDGIVSGTSTQSVHNQHTIRFTITEPNGLTFLENLHRAVKDYKTSLGFAAEKINYAAQIYLMVIRFKGHQIDGIPESLGEMIGEDKNGYSEKYIPFVFTGVRFRMEDNKIVYHCEASAPMSFYNLNATHAAIPFNVELNGGTVGDVLTANQVTLTQPATQRETADQTQQANTQEQKATLYTGLVQALNDNSKKAYGAEFANVYRIEFEEGAEFEKKKITIPGPITNKERTPMKASKEQPQAGATDRVKKESRVKTIQAGTSIVQAIEQIIRGSDYVTAQQTIEIDEATGQVRQKDKSNPQPFQWFKVVMQATPRSDKVNPATNDYAYEIVYKIKRYQVGNPKSPFFPPPIFRGVHKEYKYWFTGENTEIRNFQQDFNYLYFQQITTAMSKVKMPEINTVHVSRNFYMPRATESSEGLGASGEIAGSVASSLYSPGDLAKAEVEILGDPDWIAQSEIFYGVDKANNNPFEADGSVNINASVVYFGIEWNTPDDFNDEGLLNPKRYDDKSLDPAIQLCYQANRIVSRFSQGAFTQRLEGTLCSWVDDEYTTRVDQGFTYDAQKRVDDVNKAIEDTDDAFWAEQDAIQEQVNIRSAESIVAEQDAEFANWDEDDATTDAPSNTRVNDTAFNITADAALEYDTNANSQQSAMLAAQDREFGSEAYEDRDSTQPIFTPNAKPKTSAPNPNTMTQNTITKAGGDKTVEQTPSFQEFAVPTGEPATVYKVGDTYEEVEPLSGDRIRYEVMPGNIHEPAAIYNPQTGQWEEY